MFVVNGQMANGMWRVDEIKEDMKTGIDMLMHPFALFGSIEVAQEYVKWKNTNDSDHHTNVQ